MFGSGGKNKNAEFVGKVQAARQQRAEEKEREKAAIQIQVCFILFFPLQNFVIFSYYIWHKWMCFFFFAFYVSFRFCIILFWCFVGMGKKIYLCWTAEGRNKVSKIKVRFNFKRYKSKQFYIVKLIKCPSKLTDIQNKGYFMIFFKH